MLPGRGSDWAKRPDTARDEKQRNETIMQRMSKWMHPEAHYLPDGKQRGKCDQDREEIFTPVLQKTTMKAECRLVSRCTLSVDSGISIRFIALKHWNEPPRHRKTLYLKGGRDEDARRASFLRRGGSWIAQNIARRGSGQKAARRRMATPVSFGTDWLKMPIAPKR
jgi:hypothetical protein